jgi:hypothetical protein
LGLPLGTTKPKIEDFLPLVQKVERRLISTSAFLSQARKLEMVNFVLSSTVVYHCCTLKLHKGVIKQIDNYRKHCLWRGSDINAKQPPKAAWSSVCVPKKVGVLGVINLNTHNTALLMKFLHKLYSKADIPWVHLVWGNYYANGRLPEQQVKGSFWWRDIVNLITPYKGMASVTVQNGSSVLAWYDLWNGHLLQHEFPQLFSFVKIPIALSRPCSAPTILHSTFTSPYLKKLTLNSYFYIHWLRIFICPKPQISGVIFGEITDSLLPGPTRF